MSRYATYYSNRSLAECAAFDCAVAIRADWDVKRVRVDRFSEYNVLPYQRHLIDHGAHLAAIVVEASGEIAKAGEDPIGYVTVRHTYAYPAGE